MTTAPRPDTLAAVVADAWPSLAWQDMAGGTYSLCRPDDAITVGPFWPDGSPAGPDVLGAPVVVVTIYDDRTDTERDHLAPIGPHRTVLAHVAAAIAGMTA